MKIRVEFEITTEAQAHLDEHGMEQTDAIGDGLQNLADAVCAGEYDLEPGLVAPVVWRPAFLNDDIVLGKMECLGDEATPAHDEKWHDERCGACQKVWGECTCDTDEGDDENPTAPEHGDYVMHPAGPLGGCTAVSVDGRHKETFSPAGDKSADDMAMEWILADMSAKGFGTNIWRQDDHGGYLLLTP